MDQQPLKEILTTIVTANGEAPEPVLELVVRTETEAQTATHLVHSADGLRVELFSSLRGDHALSVTYDGTLVYQEGVRGSVRMERICTPGIWQEKARGLYEEVTQEHKRLL